MKKVLFCALLCLCAVAAQAETDREAAERVVRDYACYVESAVYEFGMPASPSFFLAQMLAESTGKPEAVSVSDARGLIQMKPDTLTLVQRVFGGHHFGDDLHDPRTNIRAAVAYHAWLKDEVDRGLRYSDAAEVAMGYLYGHNGGEKHVEEAYSHRYYKKIEYYLALLPDTTCRSWPVAM